MGPTETGESFAGRLSSESSAPPAPAPKPVKRTTWKENVGYIVCSTTLSVLVAFALLIVYHADGGVETHSLCITNECKIFARQVSLAMNRSASPCRDFYEFACGRWAEANPVYLSEAWRSTVELIAEAGSLLVVNKYTEGNQTAVDKAATLFSSCVDGDDQLARLRDSLLPQMGIQWPRTRDDTDPLHILVELSVQWQMPTLFAVRTDDFVQLAQHRSPVFDTAVMEWWSPLFRVMRDHGEYHNYVRAFYEALTTDRDQATLDRVTDTLTRCDTFLLEKKRGAQTYRNGLLDKFELQELQSKHMQGISIDRWVDALNLRWSFNVTPETTVYSMDPMELESIVHFLANFTWTESNLLIEWHVIQRIAPTVSPPLRDLLLPVFLNDSGAAWSVTAGRCMELVVGLMGIVPMWPLINQRMADNTREMADLVLSRVSRSLEKSVTESQWMDAKTARVAVRQLSGIKMMLGAPLEADTVRILSMLYEHVPETTPDFLSSWRVTLEAMRERLVYPQGYADVYCYNPLWHGVRFNDDTDTLLIPVRDMFMPNFHTSAPGAVNFAGLGALIARGFAQIFDPFEAEEALQKWSEESRRKYAEVHACVSAAYGRSWRPPMYRRQFCDLAPMKSLYRAFRPSPTKDRQLADLREFDPSQTFFISFCHAHCVADRNDQAARDRCNVPLRNLPQFSTVFKCPLGTPMNLPGKCSIW